MADKLASNSDLQSHIQMDPRVVHGLLAVVKSVLTAAINATIADLVHVQGGDLIGVPFIQIGNASSSPVIFDHAFKGSTTPIVVPVSVGFTKEIANISPPSNTGFSWSIKYADNSAGGGTLNWIAIGEKA